MALGTYAPLFDKAMSNVVEVKARGASVLALTTECRRKEQMALHAWTRMMTIPDAEDPFLPSLAMHPAPAVRLLCCAAARLRH